MIKIRFEGAVPQDRHELFHVKQDIEATLKPESVEVIAEEWADGRIATTICVRGSWVETRTGARMPATFIRDLERTAGVKCTYDYAAD